MRHPVHERFAKIREHESDCLHSVRDYRVLVAIEYNRVRSVNHDADRGANVNT